MNLTQNFEHPLGTFTSLEPLNSQDSAFIDFIVHEHLQIELGVHRFTWLLFDCQRTFVIDVLAQFLVIDVVALNS